MPIDISEELDTIENDPGFFTVKNAVGNGTEKVSETRDVDIMQELLTIRSGRYGIDIRMAIHDALAKLAQSGSAPWDGNIACMMAIGDPCIKDYSVTGYFKRLSPVQNDPFTNYTEYTGQSAGCVIDERYETATVIVCLVHTGDVEGDDTFTLINNPENTKITKSGSPDEYLYMNVYTRVCSYNEIANTGYEFLAAYEGQKNDFLSVYMFVVNGSRTVSVISEGVSALSNLWQPTVRQNFNQQLYLTASPYHPNPPAIDISDAGYRNFVPHEGTAVTSCYDWQHNLAQDTPKFTALSSPSDYSAYLSYVHLEISR